jgi:uncharacterized DUF497 family protein
LGQTPNNKILVVIHTFKKDKDKEYVRIISARKATKREIKQYHYFVKNLSGAFFLKVF